MREEFNLHGYKRDGSEVIGIHARGSNGVSVKWQCRCRCGEEFIRRGTEIRNLENSFNCSYCSRKSRVGEVFGELVVKEYGGRIDGKPTWILECSCGSIIQRNTDQMSRKLSSCGCTSNKSHAKIHGMSKTKLYKIWSSMKARCNNTEAESFPYYGGRGISYAPEWESFDGFMQDMAPSYSDGLTLDRKDNNLSYSKDNCRWVKRELQARNHRKRSTNTTGYTGVTKSGGKFPDYIASCRWIDGTYVRKSFSIVKYGEEEAFLMAIATREQMIQDLNELGQGYGEFHGK